MVARVSRTADGSAYSVEFTSRPQSQFQSEYVLHPERCPSRHLKTQTTHEQTRIVLRDQPRSHRYIQ